MNLEKFFLLIATQSLERDLLAVAIGLCVGSFLCLLALRTLAEKPLFSTLFGRSQCPNCEHTLNFFDLIPVLSFILLARKCRFCKEPISWRYPFCEITTAIAFLVVLYHYQIPAEEANRMWPALINSVGLDLAIITFFCILITVCVTDFKEKLIPHEITYPSIVVGIAFSAIMRNDLLLSLAGIGISYILFDFLAFYGLKFYYLTHAEKMAQRETAQDEIAEAEAGAEFNQNIDDFDNYSNDPAIDEAFDISNQPENQLANQLTNKLTNNLTNNLTNQGATEDFEVMGGGDAVLSALIAAWLGLQNLGIALLFGFMFGALTGAAYLGIELHKLGRLGKAIKSSSLIFACLLFLSEGATYLFAGSLGLLKPGHLDELRQLPWLLMLAASLLGSVLLGTILHGKEASKPFPFGPALAAGAAVAVLLDPAKTLKLSDSFTQLGYLLHQSGRYIGY